MGKGIFEIAALLVGVAFAALLVGHASGTSQVIVAATGGFNKLLQTVELAGGAGFGTIQSDSPYMFGG